MTALLSVAATVPKSAHALVFGIAEHLPGGDGGGGVVGIGDVQHDVGRCRPFAGRVARLHGVGKAVRGDLEVVVRRPAGRGDPEDAGVVDRIKPSALVRVAVLAKRKAVTARLSVAATVPAAALAAWFSA